MASQTNHGALSYEEPAITTILVLVGFLLSLNLIDVFLDNVIFCGLIGQILIGIAFGVPGLQWLSIDFQHAATQLGYLGLLLIVYEGGLSTKIGILKANLVLSLAVAITGIGMPIALSYILPSFIPMTSLQAFAAGAALCSTSLGTTFTILKTSELSKSRLGIVLAGAAMMDDVVGLVLVQIISDIGRSSHFEAVTLVRPITVSIAYAVVVPLLCVFIVIPVTKKAQRLLEGRSAMKAWFACKSFVFCLHSAILVAFIATTGYAGTSNLFGAYIAGACISWWDESFNGNQTSSSEELADNANDRNSKTRNADSRQAKVSPIVDADSNNNREASANTSEQASSKNNIQQPVENDASTVAASGEQRLDDGIHGEEENVLSGSAIYNKFYAEPVNRVLKPLFFASIGFSIPIARMFTRELVWRGIVYSILMIFGKLVCGLWLVRFRLRLPSIALSRITTRFRAIIKALVKHKSRSSQSDTARSREQTSTDAVSNSDATMQLQQPRPAESMNRPDTVISKPMSLYPAAILGMAMVSRGEIGFLVSAVAQDSGLYDTQGTGGADLFLVVTWAILSCTILGPMITGVLVKRVWRMQKQERSQRSGRVDPLGIWGATS